MLRESKVSVVARRILFFLWFGFLWSNIATANPALDFINKARIANGLPALVQQPQLEKAAANHARYMARHNLSGHVEKKGFPEFTGVGCINRIAHTGYPSRFCLENLSSGQDNWLSSAEELMGAIYHRLGFLHFSVDEIGFATTSSANIKPNRKNQYFSYVMGSSVLRKMCSGTSKLSGIQGVCLNMNFVIAEQVYWKKKVELAKQSADKAIYPWSGQKDVSPVFINNEEPNPLPGIELSGQPISVQFNPERFKGKKVVVNGFRLTDKAGREVALLPRKDGRSDSQHKFSEFDFAWFPTHPLMWGMKYNVTLDYTVNGAAQSVRWSFTTRSEPFSWKDKRGRMVIDRPVKAIHLVPGKAYSLVLSPELSHDRIKNVNAEFMGKCEFKIEGFNTISLRQQGSSTLTITLRNGTQYVVKISTH